MVDIRNMALNLLSQNPSISNNPNAQEFINVIRSGDSVRGVPYLRLGPSQKRMRRESSDQQ